MCGGGVVGFKRKGLQNTVEPANSGHKLTPLAIPLAPGPRLMHADSRACYRKSEFREGFLLLRKFAGGGGGIRTHGALARTTVFETAPFDHSGTPPLGAGTYPSS